MFSFRNIIILLIAATVIGIAFLSLKNSSAPIISPNPTPTESPDVGTIQSEVSESETKETSEVRSPDGKMKLIMEKTKEQDNTTYSFSVSETQGIEREKAIFSRTVLAGNTMEISPNAWSPDNKYFFITQRGIGSVYPDQIGVDYFVFRANGESFSDEKQYIDVVPRFIAKNTGYTLSEITGWDSETLLHVYTVKESGSRGSSFWFEIPSQAIIQLASR